MTEDNFKWTEGLAKEAISELSKKFACPNEYTDKWEGIEKEIEKWKQSKLQSQDKPQPSSIDRIEIVSDGNGIYTQEQKEYANSVPENQLRQHLIHQVRLRDNMESDRNSFETMYNNLCKKVDTIRREAWNAAREMPDGTQLRRYVKWLTFNEWYKSLSTPTTQPKEEDKPVIIEDNDRCGICGGEMVYIRGRYPNTDKRKVCPTCTTERLEQISDLCSPEYGKAYQNKN